MKLKAHLLFKTCLVLFVLPFFALCWFAHPAGEDYCLSAMAVDKGFWGAMDYWYYNYHGRFSVTALVTLYSVALDPFAVCKFISIFTLVGLLSGFYCLARSLLRGLAADEEISWIGILVFVLFLSSMPSLFEGIYWVGGVLPYQTGLVLALFLFSLLLSYEPSAGVPVRFLRILGICLLTVAAAGCSETILAMVLVGLAVGSMITLKWRRETCHIWMLALLVCVAVAAVVTLAPGNEFRAQNYPLRFRLGISFLKTAAFSVYMLLTSWPNAPALAAATVIVAPVVFRVTGNIAVTPNRFALSLLLWAGLFAVSVFPSFYGTGGRPGPRAIDVSCAIFLTGWFVNIFLLAGFARGSLGKELSVPPRLFKTAQIVLVASLFSLGNFPGAARDLVSGAAVTYDRELHARYATIRAASSSQTADVEVPRLTAMPQSLFQSERELHEDSDNWINKCWAQYFGVKTIRLKAN